MSPALSNDEKRQRLREGQPLHFDPPPAEGEESVEAKAARTIKAAWLEELALRPDRIVKVPIDIANAMIDGPLNLKYATFEYGVSVIGSEFTAADFSYSRFRRNLDLSRSAVRGPITLQGAVLERDGYLNGCVVSGDGNFMDLHVAGVLQICFGSFGTGVCFSGATFEKSVSFDGSSFGRPGEEREEECKADFIGVTIGMQARFRGTTFWSAAEFDGARVGGDALFRTEEKKGIRTEFRDEARFVGARVGGEADFRGAEFRASASFDAIHVDGSAFFRTDDKDNQTRFEGDVGFMRAHIGGDADFSGAEFQGKASFDGARVDGAALFRRDGKERVACFGGPTRFPSAVFGLDAQFRGTEFGGTTKFDNAEFQGAADFGGARFSRAGEAARTSFVGTRFERGVSFERAAFAGEADFAAVATEGDAHFEGAVFGGKASLRDAHIRVAHFRGGADRQVPGAEAARFKAEVDLRGFTYDRIYVAWKDLLARAEYDRQPYTQLEKALRESGEDEMADDAYLTRRARERREVLWRQSKLRWFFDWMYMGLANYGIRPYRLFWYAAFLILLGALVLSQRGALVAENGSLQPTPPNYPEAFSRGLGVSVHQFVPVDVPTGAGLRPTPGWRSAYAALGLRIAGSILVAVGAAAATGLLRRIAPS